MKILEKIEEGFVLGVLGIMCIVLIIQVFMRYVFNHPLVWSEELARYLFVWLAFVGAGYGIKHNVHIRLEAFYERFPGKMKKIVTVCTNLLCMVCYGYITVYGINFTISQNSIKSSAMGIPMSFVLAAVPIGCILLVLRLGIQTFNVIKTGEETAKGGNISC